MQVFSHVVRLQRIIEFINLNKILPDNIDSSEQFRWHKNHNDRNRDITLDYFENYNNITNVNTLYPIDYFTAYNLKIILI